MRSAFIARGGAATPQEWVVTFPDGRSATFESDTEAYRQLRLRGGGIRQQDKVMSA